MIAVRIAGVRSELAKLIVKRLPALCPSLIVDRLLDPLGHLHCQPFCDGHRVLRKRKSRLVGRFASTSWPGEMQTAASRPAEVKVMEVAIPRSAPDVVLGIET
jgi:hypothetical protein